MPRRFLIATALGAAVGAVGALGLVALAATRVIDSGVTAVVLDEATSRSRAVFEVTQGGLYILISVVGALAGAVFGAVGYAVGKETSPDSPRVSFGPLVVVGAVVGTTIGFASARLLLGIGARTELGTVSVSVFRAAIVALVAGLLTGAVVGGTVERLSRADALGFEGEAWPSSPMAFLKDAAAAVGIPVVGAIVAAVVVGGFGWLLLEVPHSTGIWLFGGFATVILIAATVIAANPPGGPSGEPE